MDALLRSLMENPRRHQFKMEKENVPQLRFPEFQDELKSVGFADVGKIHIGLTHTPDYQKKGRPFLSSKNISNGYIDFSDIQYISEEKFQSMPESTKPKKGDILFTRVGSNLGNPIVVEKDVEFGIFVSLGAYRVNEKASNYFMKNWMDSTYFWKQLEQKVAGGAKNNLNTTWLKEFKLNLPSVREQQKIASFLSAVDKKIEQLTRKKELQEEYKKGVMQKLFTYDLRLGKSNLRKGKLGDFGYFYYGKGAPKPTIQPHGKTPCVRYGELYSTYGDEIKRVKSKTIVSPEELKLSSGGEVLVPRVGEDPKDFANCSYLPFKDVAIGEMISVYNTEEDGLFMTYYINATKSKDLAKRVEGGNVSNLYYKYVEEIDIEIPSIEEQRTIVNFVKAIDFKIESLGFQIQKTQTFKKGLLQQMFV